MTIKEIDKYFLSLERQPKKGCKYTLMYARRGAAKFTYPFIIFLGNDEDVTKPNIELLSAKNIYQVMQYIEKFLKDHPNIGYFYA